MIPSRSIRSPRALLRAAFLPFLAILSGCNMVVMKPSGDVAVQQADLILISTGLMMLIIVPVIVLVVLFAWRYRHDNDATYLPDWDHSTQLELVIWAAPLLIIICLGAITWTSTHLLDPYRPIDRVAPGKQVAQNVAPLEVEVVAMDWKWLFIYPQYGIATVNELAAPVDRPIRFKITASTVMNSFYVPALAGQVYAMPGMQTLLHGVINTPGDYAGFSANYSGAGFSGMRFRFHGLDQAGFDKWVGAVRAAPAPLDRPTYLALEKPSENVPVQRYAAVAPGLYQAILNMCVRPGKKCMSDIMMIDAKGGAGKESAHDTEGLRHDIVPSEGALLKEPEEKGSSPHMSAPHDKKVAPGKTGGDPEKNRNLTQNGIPAAVTPGAAAPVRS